MLSVIPSEARNLRPFVRLRRTQGDKINDLPLTDCFDQGFGVIWGLNPQDEEENIKSAFERAWEKAQKIEATPDQIRELEYSPEGGRLAARFLKEDGFDLAAALTSYPAEARKHVAQGAAITFKSNILLPRNERFKREGQRSLEGLQALKKDKSNFAKVKERIEGVFTHYDRQRQELYNQLRQEFDAMMRQSLRQQMGVATQMRIDVESHPEFRQRWQELSNRLDQEYEERLRRLKEELDHIA